VRSIRIMFALSLGGATALVGAGCQSYSPKPLDLAAHREAWTIRDPASPTVRDFSQRLLTSAGDDHTTFDPSDGLALAEAEAITLVFNPELRLARLRAGVAAAAAQTAGLWQDPVLGTDLTRIIQSSQHPWKVFSTLSLTIPISGRLEIEKARGGAQHAAQILKVHQAEWDTRVQLREAWARWSAIAQQSSATVEFLSRFEQVVAIVNRLESAGEMPRVEARLFRIEIAKGRAALALLNAETLQSQAGIRRLMGLPPAAPLTLVPGPLVTRVPAPLDQLRDELDARNPALAVVKSEYQVSEHELELQVRKQYPDLTVGPGYGREDGQDQFLLNLALPIPILNRNQQGIATAIAEREVARGSFESTYEQLLGDLELAVLTLQSAIAQRTSLEVDIVPLVDQQDAESRRVAELGEVNTLLLLETLKGQQYAKQSLIAARLAESLASIRIDALIGPYSEQPPLTPTNQGENR